MLRAKLILKGGFFHEEHDVPPEIENVFLKNVIQFEETEPAPMYQHLRIEPVDFTVKKDLGKEALLQKYTFVEGMTLHPDVCTDYCPDCFQFDYYEVKYESGAKKK